jgi:hypothetical protein
MSDILTRDDIDKLSTSNSGLSQDKINALYDMINNREYGGPPYCTDVVDRNEYRKLKNFHEQSAKKRHEKTNKSKILARKLYEENKTQYNSPRQAAIGIAQKEEFRYLKNPFNTIYRWITEKLE